MDNWKTLEHARERTINSGRQPLLAPTTGQQCIYLQKESSGYYLPCVAFIEKIYQSGRVKIRLFDSIKGDAKITDPNKLFTS